MHRIFVYEDFYDDTMALRKYLWDKVPEYRIQNKITHLKYSSIVVRDKSG